MEDVKDQITKALEHFKQQRDVRFPPLFGQVFV